MPKDFGRVNLGITTENFALDEETLLQKGKELTELRKTFRKKAVDVAKENGANVA